MSCLTLPLHVLQASEILVHGSDLSSVSFSLRPLTGSGVSAHKGNAEIRVQSGSDSTGSFISISLAEASPAKKNSELAPDISFDDLLMPFKPEWEMPPDLDSPYSEAFIGELFNPSSYQLGNATETEFIETLWQDGNTATPVTCDDFKASLSLLPPFAEPMPSSDMMDTTPPSASSDSAPKPPIFGPNPSEPPPSYPPSVVSGGSSTSSSKASSPAFSEYTPESYSPTSSRASSAVPSKYSRGPFGKAEKVKSSQIEAARAPTSRPRRTSKHGNSNLACHYPPCEAMFSRQHDRLRHEVGKHGRKCEWTCQVCKRFFSNALTFERHKCGAFVDSRYMPAVAVEAR